MGKYVMGIDHGGTSSKAVLFDLLGSVRAVAKQSMPMLTPKPGHTERDMEGLWQINCALIRNAIAQSGVDSADIIGISFTGHGKGLYLWGNDDRPVRPGIISTDRRAQDIVDRWYADGTAEHAYAKTYQNVLVSQPVALLRWLIENEPESVKKTKYIFGVKDYIRYRMTGIARSEITDLSGSSLVNLAKGEYDAELLTLFGLEYFADKLPILVTPTEPSGAVTDACAALTGLKTGTPVAAGLFDIDACAIGMHVCDDSRIAIIAGTWAINEYIARRPVLNHTVKMNSLYCLPGYFLVEECSPTSASNYDWFLKQFAQDAANEAGEDLYTWANAQVAQVAPDAQQIIFLPYLYGGSDDPRTKSAFIGIEAWHTRAHILRAICEGIVYGHRKQVERLQSSRLEPAPAVRLAGGVVRAEGWVQMFADILCLPIETVDAEELGALGAAMTAAVAAKAYPDLQCASDAMAHVDKVYQPNRKLSGIYNKKYKRYLMVEAQIRKLFADIEEC